MSIQGVVVIQEQEPQVESAESLTGELWARVFQVTLVDTGAATLKKIRWDRDEELATVDIR